MPVHDRDETEAPENYLGEESENPPAFKTDEDDDNDESEDKPVFSKVVAGEDEEIDEENESGEEDKKDKKNKNSDDDFDKLFAK